MEPMILRGEPPKAASWGGYGYGSGSGYGYGYGSGDGSGSGYGYGYGYGSGSGSGYGSGYGSGSGYGDGYGDGSGDGSKTYWCATVPYFTAKWPAEQVARYEAAKAAGATIAFWRSDAKGQPANNGRPMEAAAPGVMHTAPGPLVLCRAGTLHATFIPPKWEGERWWIVAMHGEIVADDEDNKIGALKREILGEAL